MNIRPLTKNRIHVQNYSADFIHNLQYFSKLIRQAASKLLQNSINANQTFKSRHFSIESDLLPFQAKLKIFNSSLKNISPQRKSSTKKPAKKYKEIN